MKLRAIWSMDSPKDILDSLTMCCQQKDGDGSFEVSRRWFYTIAHTNFE